MIPFTCPHCGVSTQIGDKFAGQTRPCAACGKQVTVPARHISGTSGRSTTLAIVLALLMLCGLGCVVVVPLALAALGYSLAGVGIHNTGVTSRTHCANNLKNLTLAMRSYHALYGSYPPAYTEDENGQPLTSWRVLLLPFLEEEPLYVAYDQTQPWDSAANLPLRAQMPAIFGCPDERGGLGDTTRYVLLTGPGSLFDGSKTARSEDVRDGTSYTILLIETETPVVWTQPVDLDTSTLKFTINQGDGIGSLHPGGVHVALADGSVHFLRDNALSPSALQALSTPAGGEAVELP